MDNYQSSPHDIPPTLPIPASVLGSSVLVMVLMVVTGGAGLAVVVLVPNPLQL